MNRLQSELQRLYGYPEGPARALVLQVTGRAPWAALSRVWNGVQADLQWPAPAIAIDGSRGLQLWFSLAQPVEASQATACLAALCRRWLADVPPDRVAAFAGNGVPPWQQVQGVPPFEAGEGRWSAFVAPDLAALFADEPWLDLAPGADAQADLLAALRSTSAADFQRACGPLAAPAPEARASAGSAGSATPYADPRQFLLDVMNDGSVDLALRIEAAKALVRTG